MKNFFIWSCALLIGLSLGSCSSKKTKNSEQLDSKNIQLKELRASTESKKTKSEEVEKAQELNLQQYEAITNYTEVVKGKLNTFVEIKKAAEVRLSILDSKGVLLNTFSKKSNAGLNQYQLDFSKLEVGQYYVTLVSKDIYRRFCVAKTQ